MQSKTSHHNLSLILTTAKSPPTAPSTMTMMALMMAKGSSGGIKMTSNLGSIKPHKNSFSQAATASNGFSSLDCNELLPSCSEEIDSKDEATFKLAEKPRQ